MKSLEERIELLEKQVFGKTQRLQITQLTEREDEIVAKVISSNVTEAARFFGVSQSYIQQTIKIAIRKLYAAQQGVQLTAAGVESDGEDKDSGGN